MYHNYPPIIGPFLVEKAVHIWNLYYPYIGFNLSEQEIQDRSSHMSVELLKHLDQDKIKGFSSLKLELIR